MELLFAFFSQLPMPRSCRCLSVHDAVRLVQLLLLALAAVVPALLRLPRLAPLRARGASAALSEDSLHLLSARTN